MLSSRGGALDLMMAATPKQQLEVSKTMLRGLLQTGVRLIQAIVGAFFCTRASHKPLRTKLHLASCEKHKIITGLA